MSRYSDLKSSHQALVSSLDLNGTINKFLPLATWAKTEAHRYQATTSPTGTPAEQTNVTLVKKYFVAMCAQTVKTYQNAMITLDSQTSNLAAAPTPQNYQVFRQLQRFSAAYESYFEKFAQTIGRDTKSSDYEISTVLSELPETLEFANATSDLSVERWVELHIRLIFLIKGATDSVTTRAETISRNIVEPPADNTVIGTAVSTRRLSALAAQRSFKLTSHRFDQSQWTDDQKILAKSLLIQTEDGLYVLAHAIWSRSIKSTDKAKISAAVLAAGSAIRELQLLRRRVTSDEEVLDHSIKELGELYNGILGALPDIN